MSENQDISVNRATQAQMDWFIEIEDISGEKRQFLKNEVSTTFRTGILDGNYKKNSVVLTHSKTTNGKWNITSSTLLEFAKHNFVLRTLYQPVWSHAIAGLKWGALVGSILKLLDTLFFLGSVDLTFAIMFVLAVAVSVIPRFGIFAVIAVSIIMVIFTGAEINFFILGLSSAITGAILGCLPGMAIGGVIGVCLSRTGTFLYAPDAAPEPKGLSIKVVLIPFICGVGLFIIYIFVINTWLVSFLG